MHRRLARIAVAACAIALAVPAGASAATEMLLKIDGIEGESQDKDHKGEIDIDSFSWGVSNNGKGKSEASGLSFQKSMDSTSPLLMQAAASGQRIPCVVLSLVSTGENRRTFSKITFRDVSFAQYQVAASRHGDRPDESASFNFAKIEFGYVPQSADGKELPPVFAGWDFVNHIQHGRGADC